MKEGRTMDFTCLNDEIALPDDAAMRRAKARWDDIAKPLSGLGVLEEICIRIAGLTGSETIDVAKKAVVVFCADNGVTAEGVAQADVSVTAVMAKAFVEKRSCVCRMAAAAGADVFPVDIGMFRRVDGVRDLHIADGTANIAIGPAMRREQAEATIKTGIALVREYKEKGYGLIATGEMGIGNTTTSAAVAAVLLEMPPEQAVGRGAGLSDERLMRKRNVVRRAIETNRPDPNDAFDVLCKLGGLDIAGMAGLFLGGALYRVPIVIDGLISSVSALIAARLCPKSVCAMIASHRSAEPAAEAVLRRLSLHAVIDAGMKLGEGTGAVCMMPLIDLALCAYKSAAAFSEIDIPHYALKGGAAE